MRGQVIPRVMNVKDVQLASRRGENWVRNAAHTGALKALPGVSGRRRVLYFTEQEVADWVLRGSPEVPAKSRGAKAHK